MQSHSVKKIKTRNKVTQQRELKVRAKHYIEIKAIYIKGINKLKLVTRQL